MLSNTYWALGGLRPPFPSLRATDRQTEFPIYILDTSRLEALRACLRQLYAFGIQFLQKIIKKIKNKKFQKKVKNSWNRGLWKNRHFFQKKKFFFKFSNFNFFFGLKPSQDDAEQYLFSFRGSATHRSGALGFQTNKQTNTHFVLFI